MKKLFITILCVFSITQAFCQLGKLDSTFQSYGYAAFRVKAAKELSDGKILIATDRGLRRLNTDGTMDNTFLYAFSLSSNLYAMEVLPDGKILVSGYLKNMDDSFYGRFVRLNSDGTIDLTFKGDRNANSISFIKIRQDGKILITGNFQEYTKSSITGIALLNSDGILDDSFRSQFTLEEVSLDNCVVQNDNKVILSGNLKFEDGYTTKIARLNSNGSLDDGFNGGEGPNGRISKLIILSSGKVLIAGEFSEYDGQEINNYARLNLDGTLDKEFNPGSGSTYPYVTSVHVSSLKELQDGRIIISCFSPVYNNKRALGLFQIKSDGAFDKNITTASISYIEGTELLKNGKLLVYGSFQSVNDKPRNRIFLLNTDYSLDIDFNPGDGADAGISDFVLLPNGKIVIVGSFTSYNQVRTWGIARILNNGSLDPSFNTGTAFDGIGSETSVSAIERQPDGKFVIVGGFSIFNGKPANKIIRLLSDGSLDETFKEGTGPDQNISCVKVQSDGKIVIAGIFTSYNGKSANNIARLNSDGSLDESFNPGKGPDLDIYDIEVMPDNKVLVVGRFNYFDDNLVNRIVLLNDDGSINSEFKSGIGAADEIYCISLDKDKIYLGGSFDSFNGHTTDGVVRLNKDGSVDKEFVAQFFHGNIYVRDITIQPNGKIITTTPFKRLNYDGSIDNDFNLDDIEYINKLTIQPDGKFLIGGAFHYYNNTMIGNICRIEGGDITTPSGIFSTKEFQSFSSVYPIPTTDNLNFTVSGTSNTYDLSIYSMTGLEILNTEIPSGQSVINTYKFPMGIYIYKISNEDGEYNTGRIIINKQK
ncbi:MAG: T9SS type A sorting domain-containing protein [Sporocytophaga sp.]|nr:T9SS type A sorting domain-containing protein [Sporocytophaga sp.]